MILIHKKKTKKTLKKNGDSRRHDYTVDTGAAVAVQIKAGSGYFVGEVSGRLKVNLGSDYIQSHRPKWTANPNPVILVFSMPRKLSTILRQICTAISV